MICLKKFVFIIISLLVLFGFSYYALTHFNFNINPKHQVGDVIDTFNGIPVYYNAGVDHVKERHLT